MKRIRTSLALVVVASLSAILAGCVTSASDQALASLTDAGDRFVNRTVGPEYERYVQADPSLQPDEIRVRLDNVESFRRAIRAARSSLPTR